MSSVTFTEKDPNTVINPDNLHSYKTEAGPNYMFGLDMSGVAPSVSETVAVTQGQSTLDLVTHRFDSGDGIDMVYVVTPGVEDQYVAVGGEKTISLVTDIDGTDIIVVVKNGTQTLVAGVDYTVDTVNNEINLTVGLLENETIDVAIYPDAEIVETQYVATGGENEIQLATNIVVGDTLLVVKNGTQVLVETTDYVRDDVNNKITLTTRLTASETIDVTITPVAIQESQYVATGGETEINLVTDITADDIITVIRNELDGDLDVLVEGVNFTRNIIDNRIALSRALLENETIDITIQRPDIQELQFGASGGEINVVLATDIVVGDRIVVTKNGTETLTLGADYSVDYNANEIVLVYELSEGETIDVSIWQNRIDELQYVATGGENEVPVLSPVFEVYCITTVIKNGTTTLVKNADYTEDLANDKIVLTQRLVEGDTIDVTSYYAPIPIGEGGGFTRNIPQNFNIPVVPLDGEITVTITPISSYEEAWFIVMFFENGAMIKYQYDNEAERDSDFADFEAAIASSDPGVIPIPTPP